jgi:hypothetical protein
MSREIYSIKGNPRPPLKAPGGVLRRLTLVNRLQFSPMNTVSSNQRFDGSQPANISLTYRRVKFPCSFHYVVIFFRHLRT